MHYCRFTTKKEETPLLAYTTVSYSCAQNEYALRTFRAHGMSNANLHIVYQSVIVAKLLYAASAWCGFSTADDRQRLEAVIRRGIRSGLCPTDQSTVSELSTLLTSHCSRRYCTTETMYYTGNCFLSDVTAVMICEPGATTGYSLRRTAGLSESL